MRCKSRLAKIFSCSILTGLTVFAVAQKPAISHLPIWPPRFLASLPTLRKNDTILFRKLPARGIQNPLREQPASVTACNTATYFLHLAAPAGDQITLKDVQTLPDGNFMIAGNIRSPVNGERGLLCVIDNSGNLVAQQLISINGVACTIEGIRIHPDGSFNIAGIAHEITDKVFVACMNASLTSKWVAEYDLPQPPQKVTLDFVSDSTVALASQVTGAVCYALLDNRDGTVIWQQQVAINGLTELVGFNPILYNSLGMVVNYTSGGKPSALLFEIDPLTGLVNNTGQLGNGNDCRFYQTRAFNSRLIYTGVIKTSATQYALERNISAGAQYSETQHIYSIPPNVDLGTASSMDNSGNVMGFTIPQQGLLIFLRQFAYYETTPEYTRSYSVPVGSTISSVAESFQDGGYVFGLNTASSREILLVKTDSIGTLPGCGFQDISNQFVENIQSPNTLASYTTAPVPVSRVIATLSASPVTVSPQFDCNQLYCPAPPVRDTCLSTFYKTLRSNSYVNAFTTNFLMQNDNMLVVTARYDNILNNFNVITGGVELYDRNGNFIKGVDVYHDGASEVPAGYQVDKQHVLLIDYTTRSGMPVYTFTMIDDNLQVLWTKSTDFNGAPLGSTLTYPFMTADDQGNLYLTGCSPGFYTKAQVFVYKMDRNGNPLWYKTYAVDQGELIINAAICTRSSLIVINEGDRGGSVSLQIDKNTGDVLNTYYYQNTCAGSDYYRYLGLAGDHIFYVGNDQNESPALATFDTTGKPLHFKILTGQFAIATATSDAQNLFLKYHYYGTGWKDVLMKVDTALTIQYDHEYDELLYGFYPGIAESTDGSLYVAGSYSYGGVNGSYLDTYIEKYDRNGIMGTCHYQDVIPLTSDENLNTQKINTTVTTGAFNPENISEVLVPDTSGNVISNVLCSSPQLCSSVSVSGPSSVCHLNQPYVYTSKTNPGCTLRPQWIFDSAYVTLQSYTDSTASFIFRKTGTTWIKVALNAGCHEYYDSLLAGAQDQSDHLELGRDTTICPGDSIILNAGSGFAAYLWNTGNTDSSLMVYAAGTYFIDVKNACGESYSDTIHVLQGNVPLFSIGKDTAVCIGDTVHITASPGFANYYWQPSPPLVASGSNATLVIFQNETIMATAITGDGCDVTATLHLAAISPRPVFLGRDTGFCSPGTLNLDAGSAYSTYNWNTGSKQENINVNSSGTYWVHVTDVNGCAAGDTIKVVVFLLPAPILGEDFSLCSGTDRVLDPGAYNTYLWQDGSTQRTLTARDTGTYWVTVKDLNNCAGNDTVIVLQILPSPAGFLSGTDSICQYEQVSLEPRTAYSSYLWSTGPTSQQITVEQPGDYILTVTDMNGCKGSDTVHVIQKNCYQGVYIPNAFTPNGDHLNDIFRAKVFGVVNYFKLTVYNRFGQIVYSTSDPAIGWDGTFRGLPADPDVYIWQCSYLLQGGSPISEKGTVTLMK